MSSRDSDRPLLRLLRRHFDAHRRARVLRAALRAAAGAAVLIVLGVLAGVLVAGGENWAWARLFVVLGALLFLIARAVAGVRAASPGFDTFLERIEGRFPDVKSWLRNALEFEHTAPAHSSPELAHAVAVETAERVAKLPLDSTRPKVDPRRPIGAIVAATLAIVALVLIAPSQTRRSWGTLLDPASAAPPVKLAVEPGSVRVTPGASLTVRARVWGTLQHPGLERQRETDVDAAAEGRDDDGSRVWRFDLTQLTREQTYRVKVGRVSSPEYHIELAGEPAAVSFEIEYVAPAYAHLPVQRGAATRGDLAALQGTRARVVVTFDRDLTALSATLPGGRSSAWTSLTPRRWSGEVPMLADGEYELKASAAAGEGRFRYRVSVQPDAPPILAVQTPTGDMDLPAGQRIPVSILAQDDLGLGRLRLQYRKETDSTWSAVSLAEFAAHPREASVQTTWDASVLGLLPGQNASFRFELEDDNVLTGPGRARSAEFQLRFPSLADLYDHMNDQQTSARQALEKAAEQAKEVQKSLDQLSRQPQQAAPQQANNFERSEEFKNTFQRQMELGQKVDQAVDQLRQSLEQAAERQAYNEELMTKLKEMSELMRQIQSPEFRDALKKMQEALERMDRQQLEQQLPDWRAQNKQLLEQLKRSIEMLKQMKQEQMLEELAQRAEELKKQQDALNKEQASKPSDPKSGEQHGDEMAQRQEQAAQQTEKLAQDAQQLAKETAQKQDQPRLEQAANQLQNKAAPTQRQAAKSSRGKQPRQAQQEGEQASQELQEAAQQLSQMSAEAQERHKQVDLAAVRRASQDLVSLQRESEQNLNSQTATRKEQGNKQSDLSDGVSRVADSLSVLAEKQPFITPSLGQSLGRAINSLQESGRQLATGNPSRGEQAGHEGSQALNQAIFELRASESSMCNNPKAGGSKPGGSAGEMLGEMGNHQSQLNQETRNITQRLSQQMRLSAGDQAKLRDLAQQQKALREQLEQIQKDEQVKHDLLGRLDQTQKEMKEAEEVMTRGEAGDDLTDKQQRILSRLLDAQRSVNRRDFEPQRESRPGEVLARASAPELPADLLRENDRLRLDLLRAESDRYPAQYRAYIEAYLRSLNQQRATPSR